MLLPTYLPIVSVSIHCHLSAGAGADNIGDIVRPPLLNFNVVNFHLDSNPQMAKDWAAVRDEIRSLYRVRNMPLSKVMSEEERKYDFIAL